MKWNGTVSHSPASGIAAKLIAAKAAQLSSTQYLRSVEAVTDIPDRLDHALAQLRAQPTNAHLDSVRARVEGVAPDLVEQLLARADLVAVPDEGVEQQELASRKRHHPVTDVGRTLPEVEHEPARPEEAIAVGRALPDAPTHASNELVQGERLRDVVDGAEIEALPLRLDVG